MATGDTDITIINAALTRTGSDPIGTLNDAVAGAKIAKANYGPVVKAALAHPFNFAKKFAVLVAAAGDPLPAWQYTYQLPSDMIELRSVEVDGKPIEYDTIGDKLYCDFGAEVDVVAIYTWKPAESTWPPLFVEAIQQRLESLFLAGIGERFNEAEARDRTAERTMARAKLRDAQGRRSPKDPRDGSLLRARRG